MMSDDLDWRNAHRIRLHHFANNHSEVPVTFITPDFTPPVPGDIMPDGMEQQEQKPLGAIQERLEMRTQTLPTEEINRFYFDMALAGEPIQCLEEDGTCEALRYVMTLRGSISGN
jgi:hypothetical protein